MLSSSAKSKYHK